MRRWLWRIMIALLLAAALGFAAAAGVAGYGPFDPGDGAFYRGQRGLEDALVSLRSSPKDRVMQRLQFAARRLRDVERLAGGEFEGAALGELEQALREAVRAASICPQADAGMIRPALEDLFQNTAKVLDRMGSSTSLEPGAATTFRMWLAGVTQRLGQPDLRLADLALPESVPVNVTRGKDGTPIPTPADPAVEPVPVDPHMVYFPPASMGAKHQFYPLVGRHGEIDCASCHPKGEYAGTANVCESCHERQKPLAHFPGKCELCHAPTAWADVHYKHVSPASDDCSACHLRNRPSGHYPGQCSACHSTQAWTPASFDHGVAGATDCLACHTRQRPAGHWNGQCSACHSTAAWLPATFNHAAAGATDCVSCHEQNRPAGHWGGQCSACHSTSGWLPATFNHAAAGATDCQACHEQNRPSGHWGGQCSACHSTSGWLPANFNHAAAGATDCISCHLGRRPANHYDGQCSLCHNTSAWTPASFNHTFPTDHGGANGQCSTCHPSGTSAWTCFTCHDQGEMDKKHNEKGIPDYPSRCMECHADGRKHDD